MTEESDSSNRDADSQSSDKAELSGDKTARANAGVKSTTDDMMSDVKQKSGEKEPSGSESPSADGLSIPSSVDPDAPSSTDSSSDE